MANDDMAEQGVKMRVVWNPKNCGLSNLVVVPEDVVEADKTEECTIADWLSDKFGFCVQELSFVDDEDCRRYNDGISEESDEATEEPNNIVRCPCGKFTLQLVYDGLCTDCYTNTQKG